MNTKSATSGLVIKTALILVAVGGAVLAPLAYAQTSGTVVDQTVDQVEVFSSSKVLRLKFDPTKFVGLAAAPTANLRACQTSNINGLFCLDGQIIRQWPTVLEHSLPPIGVAADYGLALFSCQDDALGLASSNPCSSMTVDADGDVWISGAKAATGSYSLIEIVKKNADGSCPATTSPLLNTTANGTPLSGLRSLDFCFVERLAGRPLILDLSPVEGELVGEYFSGPGIIGVENRATPVFYPYANPQGFVEIGAWPVSTGELVASASILQRQEGTAVNSYALIATSTGRVFSRNLDSGATSMFVHLNSDSDPLRLPRGSACVGGLAANQFKLRASETSGRVFATNRNYCKTFVMVPLYNSDENIEGIDTGHLIVASTGSPYPPDGISVSPGVSVNVGNCEVNEPSCDFLGDGDGNGFPAVKMYDVSLAVGSPTGMKVYKIENIPDCRYIRKQMPVLPAGHPCEDPATVVTDDRITDGSKEFPQRQYLNVTPMLPANVTDLFDDSGKRPTGLPPLLIQPRYRAQAVNGYVFEALFGVADPNIRFRKSFTVQFDIGDFNLAGYSLGCGVHQTDNETPANPTPKPFNQWDIVTMVSERYTSVGGPTGNVSRDDAAEHVDTMINKECFNPTPTAGTRWSMYSYNMELAEDTPVKSGKTTTGFVYSKAVKYLGNLLLTLHTELGEAQAKLACENVDALGNAIPRVYPSSSPLSNTICNDLKAKWSTAQEAMKKCAGASNDTGTSYPAKNCDAFYKAFTIYQTTVKGLEVSGLDLDPANRAGELWSRTDVIEHVFTDHFKKAWQFGPGIANAQYLPGTP